MVLLVDVLAASKDKISLHFNGSIFLLPNLANLAAMARISILVAFVVVFSAAETTSAQEIGLAPAPDAGAGFSLAQSGASWLLLSVVALLRH